MRARRKKSAAAIEATAALVPHNQRAVAIADAPTSVQAVARSQQLLLWKGPQLCDSTNPTV